MSIHLRADRAVFKFSGPDAHKLLNDVVTGRIPVGPGPAVWWALLSPQGKILAEGLCGWAEDALWLDLSASIADDFFKRMRMYKLRAQLTIEDLRATHRVGWSAEMPTHHIAHADSRAGGLGFRVIAPLEETALWSPEASPFLAARIAAGIAELGPDFDADSTFAHDIGMDVLDGIDFVKGCYVGQEVVSRMKHRGTARRRPVIVGEIDAPSGSAVVAGSREAGTLGAVLDGKSVGIIRLDRIDDLASVTVAGKPVTLTIPTWASYAFGESATQE